ncbi:Fumarylacetoacetate hydrolase family protein [Pseudoalteromonas luteoviolacea B = ATCC 29581]|nr:Fumarylacetoacetate hydrolase family protein [Pseudoalteromonas luteoviolacea B = ATCC 29581]
MYVHRWSDGTPVKLPVGKVVCIGRNYAEHAQELNNPVPDNPILFIKPASAITAFSKELSLHAYLGEHHYEAELALLVGETITRDTVSPLQCIEGMGLALDLTLRALQSELKAKGHPWERAKAFDRSCPLTGFVRKTPQSKENYEYRFWQNGELKQHGQSSMMLFNLEKLLGEISDYFTLEPGDVVLTGTPKGVGALRHNDRLTLQLGENTPFEAKVNLE